MTQHLLIITLFYYREEKLGWHFKILSFSCFLLFKYSLSLKLRNLKYFSREVSAARYQKAFATWPFLPLVWKKFI